MNNTPYSLKLTIGPLHYKFLAHDKWGERALLKLRRNVDCLSFAGAPDRVLHCLRLHLSLQESKKLRPGGLLELGARSQTWR